MTGKGDEIRLKRVVMLSFDPMFNESEAESSGEAYGALPTPETCMKKQNPENLTNPKD